MSPRQSPEGPARGKAWRAALAERASAWIFRLGEDRAWPIPLTQRRIFILPTGAGVLYALMLLVMLLGAINYQLSLGYALTFLLAGLGFAGMVHTFRNLLDLRFTPGHASPVFAGELARFPLTIDNARSDPRPAVTLSLPGAPPAHCTVPPGANRVLLACPAPRRGWLRPGRITVSTRFPLGLFRAWAYLRPAIACLVWPQPIARPLPPPSHIADPGAHRGDTGNEDFAGLRPRVPSDPPRHVAWRAVARAAPEAPLLVKRFAGGGGEELWLDWAQATGDSEERLSILAGWVLAAEALGIDYGLRLPGREAPPAHGPAHRDACLDALALFDDRPGIDAAGAHPGAAFAAGARP